MSPRSEEFMAAARERLAGARDALTAHHPALAVSAAYYAMLYAARAALSEEDHYAKTHAGTWSLFSRHFVATGRFDPDLAKRARQIERAREMGDYEAASLPEDQAREDIQLAASFVEAIEQELAS